MSLKFIVHKPQKDVEVLLLPHKGTDTYSFVNLTDGHICACNSVQEAIQDMDMRMRNGLIDGYEEV